MKWLWRWSTSADPVEPARDVVEAPATLFMEEQPKTYCVITRSKVGGKMLEHHSVCALGESEVPQGAIRVTTGHWV
jgi:hypothetical protein